jgi:hypothetical protein
MLGRTGNTRLLFCERGMIGPRWKMISDWLGLCLARRHVGNSKRLFGVALPTIIFLLVCASILELGAWKRTEIIRGPFASAGEGLHAYVARVGVDMPFRTLFGAKGDRPGNQFRSDLELRVNGEIWGPAHAPFTVVNQGETRAFTHWIDRLFFALPAHFANDERVTLTLSYSVKLRDFYSVALAVLALATFILWVRAAPRWVFSAPAHLPSDSMYAFPAAVRLLSIATYVFPAGAWLLVIACVIYGATVLYGIGAGYALPTATIFRLFPGAHHLTAFERALPYPILVFAAAGTLLAWMAALRLVPAAQVRRTEIRLMRMWRFWSLPVILCLFLFSISSGGWSGRVRAADTLNYMSLAGLVPYSDASGYFGEAFLQAYWGQWDIGGSRRPLAQAFRQLVIFIAEYSYVGTLLVQLGILVFVTDMVGRSIARWRGIWAGIAFIGFMYLLARPFLSTTLTEPLGLIWTLFAMIFLIEAVRLQSMQHALIALTGLTFALFTRMGSLFSIPFFVIWVVVAFAAKTRRIRVLGFACGAVAVVVTINTALAFFYGSPSAVSGGNFAWSLCGLTLGGDWSSCMTAYAAEYGRLPSERDQVWFLLSRAWDNILYDPTILVNKLRSNLRLFIALLPNFLLTGYGYSLVRLGMPNLALAVLFLLPGLWFVLRYRAAFAERKLWPLLGVSILLSAAVVFADDGWRVLSSSHPLIACFVALGFSAPGVVTLSRFTSHWRWQSGAALVAITAGLFLVIPVLSHVLARRELAFHARFVSAAPSEHVVAGGKKITGFIVMPDGTSSPVATASLPLSEFKKLIQYTRLENEFGPFLEEVAGEVPFAFVAAPRLDSKSHWSFYIAPPAVLEQREVWAWRLTLGQRTPPQTPWRFLQHAVAAQIVP